MRSKKNHKLAAPFISIHILDDEAYKKFGKKTRAIIAFSSDNYETVIKLKLTQKELNLFMKSLKVGKYWAKTLTEKDIDDTLDIF